GVSGTNDDNPYAPPRSGPYPLPHFEMSGDDRFCAEKLKAKGLILHSVPQARTRVNHDGRPACMTFGVCNTCPVGARYSPAHHLMPLVNAGKVTLHLNTSV